MSTTTKRRSVPRVRDGEHLCPVCERPAQAVSVDERGYLLQHVGRGWPCRIPNVSYDQDLLGDPASVDEVRMMDEHVASQANMIEFH